MLLIKLLNEHSLADTSTAEETNLSTTGVGSEQVDDLDTSDQNLGRGGLINERRGLGVDGQELVSLDGTTLVNGVTSDVHDTTQGSRADGNGDGGTSVGGLGASDETFGTCYESESGLLEIENEDNVNEGIDVPSMAMQRTTFSPRCC